MKKLMTILASAATALFAIGSASADDWTISTSVEDIAPGQLDLPRQEGETQETYYWFLPDSNDATGLIVTNYVNGEGTVISGPADVVSRPDVFEDAVNTNYLAIDISDRLYRKVGGTNQDGLDAGVTIPEKGIYLDTLVMFTAAEEEFDENALGDGDKIAIEYVEREVEEDNVTTTQRCFVVRAGYIGSEQLDVTNYVCSLESMDSFDKSKWHRLTVRTIPSIDADNHVGFVVYVDEEPIKYDTNVAAGDDFTATGAALAFYDSNTHALFPSAIASGDDKNTIAAAAFSGTGAIDDVVLTSETPNFITASEQIPATITLGTGIASVTVTVGDKIFEPVDASASPLVFMLDPGTESFNLGVTADTTHGYTFAGIDGATLSEGVVTWEGATPTFTVLATRDSVSYIDDNDQPVACATLSEAFANAKDGSTITLAYDVDSMDTEGSTFAGYATGDGEYVLDLAGHTIYGGDDGAGVSLITVNGTLTIIDSVGGGGIVYDTEYYGIVKLDGSDAYIGAATGDMGARFTGYLFEDGYEGTIIRGYFDVDSNTDTEDAFAFPDYIDNGSTCAADPVAGYWFVAPSGEEPPATHAISWTITGGTTESAEGDFIEGSTIVFTADEGKTLSFVSIDGVEIDDTSVYGASSYTYTVGAADAELVVEFTEPIIGTYEVTVTPATNATYAAVYTNDNSAVTFTENVANIRVGLAILITATPDDGFEYATAPEGGWTLTEGVITKVVDAADTVAIPEPTAVAPQPTYYATVNLGENVTAAYYAVIDDPDNVDPSTIVSNAVVDGVAFVVDPAKGLLFLGATCADGYEVDDSRTVASLLGATFNAQGVILVTNTTASITVYAKQIEEPSEYPTYIPDDAEVKAKYDTWAAAYGADVNSEHEDAFLLNCDPADVDTEKAAFKLNITVDGDTVTVTTPDGKTYNGTVQLKGSNDLSTWTPVESASKSYQFYKAELGL